MRVGVCVLNSEDKRDRHRELAGARQLLTEDLNDGQEFDGIRIINPFRAL